MKHHILFFLTAMAMLVLGCTKGPVGVSSISLEPTTATLKVGQTVHLDATVLPVDADDKTVTWSSSNSGVASVQQGTVTAVSLGNATITATAGEKTATCSITVEATPVYSITLDKTTATLKVGETIALKATVDPSDATDKSVSWTSSNDEVATVKDGVVTAVSLGEAVITASAGAKTATCKVVVEATPVTAVMLDKSFAAIRAGETVTLTATILPEDATDKTIVWTSSDETVATVSDGVVTGLKVGKAVISAEAGGKNATCQVTVEATPVTSVTLDKTSASLRAGETVVLTATVNPSDATDKTVTWSSSDASVAMVSDGVVTAVKVGSATITAKAGDKTATCQITVEATPVTSVSLDKTFASLKAGESVTLTAKIEPADATDKSVTWSSSDASVAAVNNGVVTALRVGSATITAKAGDKSATCQITVEATPVTSVTLDKTSATLRAGDSVTLTANVSPSDATDKTVTWSSSDASVATVTNGVVTAVKVGEAVITAKAGDKTATCYVSVVVTPVTSVMLDKSFVTLKAKETVKLTATVLPDDATDKTVKWSSSDESVATVSDGLVTAVRVGKAVITASAGDKTAACSVTVEATPVTSVTLDKTSATLRAGASVTLTANVSPSDATDKTVVWSTSDASVATVNNGVVTAIKVGSATITAKAGDKTATCQITVEATPVMSVTLDKTTATLRAKETVTIVATVNPSDATDKTVVWSTSDASVATVNNGVVTAIKVGSTTITAKAGDKTATCQITVEATPVTSVTLDKTTATLRANETVTLTATVNPSDATDKTVVWSTSDASVATVNNGVVTAVKVGSTTITAKAGDKTATCQITVEATPVTSITLDKSSANLGAGQTVTIVATVNPEDATDKTVTWSTSDATIATVSNGVVTAVKVGSATITAKAGEKTATCLITVVVTPVSSITLDKSSATLKAKETLSITATVGPENATDKTVTWSSSDISVATVNNNGVVTAVKVGTTVITASAGNKTAICKITVEPTLVTGIFLDKTSVSLRAGQTAKVSATVIPNDATDKTVTWISSNTEVATVEDGVISALKVGSVTITAKAGDKTATCSVNVKPTPVTSVSLDKTNAAMNVGESVTLSAVINPTDATDKTVTWSTSDVSVAIVNNGVVTGVGGGSATITVKTNDGGKVATCAVQVTVPVASVSLDKTSLTLVVGNSESLAAIINPSDATNQSVSWSSTNPSVATVSDGKVTAVKAGSATITVTTADGQKTATCAVAVKDQNEHFTETELF